MKISIGALSLGDDERDSAISDFRKSVLTLSDIVQRTRALAVTPYGRGNVRTTISWTCRRLHASEEAAAVAACSHSEAVPEQGDVDIEIGAYSYQLADAVRETCDTAYGGCETFTSYQFTGGLIVDTTPT